jgi:cyclomaltodextrinase
MMTYTDPDWVNDAVFYQIFVDRFANGDLAIDPPGIVPWGSRPTRDNFFGGDFQGILNHLPYLENLGVTALYLTPIFKAPSNHKYDCSDYLTVDPSFGSYQLFRQFVDEAHSRGIRIVLDAVFNHCGDNFWAFEDVRKKGASSKYASWFFIDDYPIIQDPPHYQTCGGVWYMPKLNTRNPEVREYLLKAATYWMESCGIDGWRLDVPWKASMEFWKLFRERIKKIRPDAYIVGEVWRDPRPWLQGDTCDGVMNYPLRNYILDYCVFDTMDAEDFDYEINLLRQANGDSAKFQLNLLGSHDTPRVLTLCKEDVARVILAVTFLFTYVGTPMIFYGDEIGLLGDNDPDCRKCMSWKETEWEQRLVNIYKNLIHIRSNHPALRRGEYLPLLIYNGIYAYLRRLEDDEVIVILNPREVRHQIKIPIGNLNLKGKVWQNMLGEGTFKVMDNHLQIETLPSKSALVLSSHQ